MAQFGEKIVNGPLPALTKPYQRRTRPVSTWTKFDLA